MAIFGCPPDVELIAQYADAGVDRLTLRLPTVPEDETLSTLDDYAELAAKYR